VHGGCTGGGHGGGGELGHGILTVYVQVVGPVESVPAALTVADTTKVLVSPYVNDAVATPGEVIVPVITTLSGALVFIRNETTAGSLDEKSAVALTDVPLVMFTVRLEQL
jgi:hypothetical protein